MSRPELRELCTLEQACDLIDDWIAAYNELRREFVRMEHRAQDAEFRADQRMFLLRHLDPFLPDQMQDEQALSADPKVYAALAPLRLPRPRSSPFEEMVLDDRDPFA